MNIERIKDELAQAWTVAVKDVRVYYLRPGMIMFGFMMPFFMFFSFSVRREAGAAEGVARLLAMTVFFTAGAAGPFIIPTERKIGTYDRLLAAPMSLLTLLLGKTAVGMFFAIVVSGVALLAGLLFFGATILQPGLLVVAFCCRRSLSRLWDWHSAPCPPPTLAMCKCPARSCAGDYSSSAAFSSL
jgi:ABC-2 type transport system permease protein